MTLSFLLLPPVTFGQPSRPKQGTLPTVLSEKNFNQFFPRRIKFFSYAAFSTAINQLKSIQVKVEKRGDWIYKITRTDKSTGLTKVVRQDPDWDQAWAKAKPLTSYTIDFAAFGSSKDIRVARKELAAFFAQAAHETRDGADGDFNDGLMLKTEVDTSNAYIVDHKIYPPVPGKKYYGRGPLQLSYNGNYGFASECILGDKNILLQHPERVAADPVLAFKTAIYFWMAPQSLKPSAHSVITGEWQPTATDLSLDRVPGFGMTINIINGALECNKGSNKEMNDRIGFYKHFLAILGLKDDEASCSCAKMASY